jgi:hypothetical protein
MARMAPFGFAVYYLILFISPLFAYEFLYSDNSDFSHLDAKAIPLKERQEHSHFGMLNISGESYGNSGGRFASFVECFSENSYSTKYFSGGSELTMSVTLRDNQLTENQSSAVSMASGFWQLNLRTYGESSVIVKNGTFYSGQVTYQDKGDPIAFILHGVESTDTVCGGEPIPIIIKGSCSTPSPFYYTEEDGDKIGSATPPNGHKIYYLFTRSIGCS